MVLISFEHLYEIHIFPKFRRCGSKIVPVTPFWNLNFKWAWQAQFLSQNLLSLQNCLFFTNKEMMLVSFFEINDGIWDKNFACHCHIHFLSHPCIESYIKCNILNMFSNVAPLLIKTQFWLKRHCFAIF